MPSWSLSFLLDCGHGWRTTRTRSSRNIVTIIGMKMAARRRPNECIECCFFYCGSTSFVSSAEYMYLDEVATVLYMRIWSTCHNTLCLVKSIRLLIFWHQPVTSFIDCNRTGTNRKLAGTYICRIVNVKHIIIIEWLVSWWRLSGKRIYRQHGIHYT